MADICTVCNKPGWPGCGHLDGMPTDEPVIAGIEEEAYRKRGRPKLPPDMRRREKLVISFTGEELKDILHAAADAEGGPMKVQDWAREKLTKAAKK